VVRLEKELEKVGKEDGLEHRPDRLAREGYQDASNAAEEAIKEAEYNMMIEEIEGRGGGDTANRANRQLRRVEMEEVEDEDL